MAFSSWSMESNVSKSNHSVLSSPKKCSATAIQAGRFTRHTLCGAFFLQHPLVSLHLVLPTLTVSHTVQQMGCSSIGDAPLFLIPRISRLSLPREQRSAPEEVVAVSHGVRRKPADRDSGPDSVDAHRPRQRIGQRHTGPPLPWAGQTAAAPV